MNKMKIIYPIVFGALGLLAVGCGSKKNEEKKEETPSIEKVKIMVLEEQTVSKTVEYPATLVAFEEIYLASSIPGRIEKIYVEVGSKVSKGDLLVQMDKTQFYQAEVQLQNIATDFKRLDTLNKLGSASKQAYDQMKTQYEIAQSNVAHIAENTKLLAPFSGVISGKYYEDGEMYSGSPNTSVGKAAIISLVQVDYLKAYVAIPESLLPLVKMGMDVKLTSDVYPNQMFDGKIFRIHPTIDAASRTFQVEVKIANAKGILRPGMFCRVTFELGETKALIVPAYAVLKLQGSNERYVFIEEDGKAKRVNVTLGKRFEDEVEIISNDLKKGDRIIVTGQARLFEGVAVEVIQ